MAADACFTFRGIRGLALGDSVFPCERGIREVSGGWLGVAFHDTRLDWVRAICGSGAFFQRGRRFSLIWW